MLNDLEKEQRLDEASLSLISKATITVSHQPNSFLFVGSTHRLALLQSTVQIDKLCPHRHVLGRVYLSRVIVKVDVVVIVVVMGSFLISVNVCGTPIQPIECSAEYIGPDRRNSKKPKPRGGRSLWWVSMTTWRSQAPVLHAASRSLFDLKGSTRLQNCSSPTEIPTPFELTTICRG